MNNKPRIILSGGGTGGHIYPALAIAKEIQLQFPEAEILFVGAKGKMEMQKVPAAGFVIKGLWISGLQRKLTVKNLLFPLKLIWSFLCAIKILKDFKPNVVVGTGGFASGAVLKMAQLLNIPTLVQEQNSYPGITNKMLGAKAKAICVAYDNMENYFNQGNCIKTGNPVRQDILNLSNKKQEAISYFNLSEDKKNLVILGGSLGAQKINELVESHLDFFMDNNLNVLWQCGSIYFERFKKYQNQRVQVFDFIERMDMLYASADIIISRAGACSVSELALVGKPVLFIPSPNVAEDHQSKNAQSIVKHNGALLIKESDLTKKFKSTFLPLINQSELVGELSKNFRALALPNATKDIVKELTKLF